MMNTLPQLKTADAVAADGRVQTRRVRRRNPKKPGPVYVYTIANIENGKAYVGITSGPYHSRWKAHLRHARNGKPWHISCALRKYGETGFYWQVVAECLTREDAIRAEKTFRAAGWAEYNMTDGGEGVVGHKRSPEWCAKKSASMKGKPARNKGIKVTDPEILSRISAAAKARPPASPETIAKIVAKTKGQKRTVEQKARMPQVWLGRKHTPETLAKMSKASKGRKRTPESIAKAKATCLAKGIKHHTCGSPENTKKGWITRKLNMEKRQILEAMGPVPAEVHLDG